MIDFIIFYNLSHIHYSNLYSSLTKFTHALLYDLSGSIPK